ncbi:hypothetical protein [Lichenicola sp.]|uniref:hypothetical protein n=1 Tax=Lichenicola sp. TaxID=2804529 RepID=UPI003B00FF65
MTPATPHPPGNPNVGRSLSIGIKLGAGFAALTRVTALLGVFALSRMGAMNDTAGIIRANPLASAAQSGLLAVALMDARRAELRMVFARSEPATRPFSTSYGLDISLPTLRCRHTRAS